MWCAACGWETGAGRRFCGGCAAGFPGTCAGCGTRNETGVRFCETCDWIMNLSVPPRAGKASPAPASFAGGRYRVLGVLGERDNKAVYAAHDMRLRRDVALTVIKIEGLDEAARASIKREVRSLARLGEQPHILTIYEVGVTRRQPYVVSQYMAGGSLEDRLSGQKNGRLPIADAVAVAAEVCEALDYAHSRGVLHRDLKPANILFTSEGVAKIGDLGFGLILATELSRLMCASMTVGTVAYSAPEQALAGPFDARGDLYSLGAILYEMTTGRPPFMGENLAAVVTQHVHLRPAPPSWRTPEIPKDLEALILRLLAKSPDDRPASAAAVRLELRAIARSLARAEEAAALAHAEETAAQRAPEPAAPEFPGPAPVPTQCAEPLQIVADVERAIAHLARDTARIFGPLAQTERQHAAVWTTRPLGAALAGHPVLAGASLAVLLAFGLGWVGHERAWGSREIARVEARRALGDSGSGERYRSGRDSDAESSKEVNRDRAETASGDRRDVATTDLVGLAEAGDAHAQSSLGDMYLSGRGVERNYDEALKWLRKAADQDDADAKVDLGIMYSKGWGVPQDYLDALQWFYQAGSKGNRDGQYHLGIVYLRGEGVTSDYTLALDWLRKAVAHGSRDAEFELGRLYRDGIAVERNPAAALDWLGKAAAQGSTQAKYELGKLYLLGEGVTQDNTRASQWFLKAAADGDAQAQNALAYMYQQGQGVAQDYNEALKWYRAAARQGDAKAQLNLGLMYENGDGIAQDFGQAVRWYRSAASQGDSIAEANLGQMYSKGRGVPRDYDQALQWFLKAAAQGNAEAQYALGSMYDNGRGLDRNSILAALWYRKAAEQGSREAQYYLGYMYENGEGVSRDLAKALLWYRKAADRGEASATQKLKDLVLGGGATTTVSSTE